MRTMQRSLDNNAHRSGERCSDRLGFPAKTKGRLPRHVRYYPEVIAVSLPKLCTFYPVIAVLLFLILFMLLRSAWDSVVKEHRLNRKTPLHFVTYKVSTIFQSYFNPPMMLPIYQFIRLDDESFSRKVVSAATKGD